MHEQDIYTIFERLYQYFLCIMPLITEVGTVHKLRELSQE